jgi:NADH:ubiquinone oxidoreductase subunit E
MSKQRLTVFVCQGKDCRKAWEQLTDSAPEKWLKRRVEEAALNCKLRVVGTECQDNCEDAACLCAVCGPCAALETRIRSKADADRLMTALRGCTESAAERNGGRI